jgi:hypothetical protein
MHTPGPTPLSEHWVSLVQAVQVLAGMVDVAVRLQIGVVPLQSVLVTHWTHSPAMVPVVAQTGLAPVQGPVVPPPPSGTVPPSAAPPSEPPLTGALAVAPGTLQPTHWFCTQKAALGFGQSLLCTHWTQLPDAAQTGELAGHELPPSALLPLAQETQVFCAEQNGTPASLLHWLLILQATHLVFTQ